MEGGKVEIKKLNGKKVTTIVADSAILAWGKTLLAMGLLDEITLENALGTFESSRMKKKAENDAVEQSENDDENEAEKEDETAEERELRRKIKAAKRELEEARAEDQEASIELAEARLSCIGPFLCNPFQDKDVNYSQQVSWLTTVIRKEKAKMGSTGNKKKVVTATDLLERNDTFFNTDIESLVEGLPGSEMLPNYDFHSFRAGFIPSAISEAWQQMGHLRPPRPSVVKSKKPTPEVKPVKQATIDLEREVKRQKRDDERDSRKRQKDEEIEQKKKARADERLSRLSIQVDERLFKEACFQREKVIVAMAKSFSRECNRRKKAAELIAMQCVMDDTNSPASSFSENSPQELSPLCTIYDEDVLRCWDFVASYGESMVQWGYIDKLPTLDSIQQALDALNPNGRKSSNPMTRSDAVDYLIDLCISLCKPLAVSLTRLLFASLIALNPALQKDFGAAFFAEVRTNANKEEADGPSSSDLLPVNKLTWQEVARLAFLSDALGELGNQKHEIAHLLRGYRSMGHPNSKEAKRLRRTEDFPIATLRQVISQGAASQTVVSSSNGSRVRILGPCKPTSNSDNWQFYLHNIKGLHGKKIALIKSNLEKAMEIAKAPGILDPNDEVTVSEMEKALAVFAKVAKISEPTPAELTSCNRARMSLMRLLEKATGDIYSSDVVKEVVHRDIIDPQPELAAGLGDGDNNQDERARLGLSRYLSINEKVYKEIGHAREEYMADALTLKEEMEYQGDDEDEDDEDEDNVKDSEKSKEGQDVEAKSGEESTSGKTNDTSKGKLVNQQAAEVVATVVENGDDTVKNDIPTRIGKVTPYDDFCADIPTAPELIRRCLAVLRVVAQTNAAEPFIYPVDPQTNPGYYESILRPMCMREVGKNLFDAAKDHSKFDDRDDADLFIEATVAKFARDVRVIAQNCSCYPSAGATVIAAGDELLRIFERLLLDWVLAPRSALPSLEDLDDDKCVEFHDSDDDSLVLLCDGCEGKYNMSRLEPPLRDVPKGDWFCPRCLSGRCWESLDPRKDKVIMRSSEDGGEEPWTIEGCYFVYPDNVNSKTMLKYKLRNSCNAKVSLTVDEIDKILEAQGTPVDPVHCIEAVSECPGYSQGPNRGLYENLVPVPSNPRISDAACQAFISSTVYQDTIISSSTFMLVNPEDLQAAEWSRLLTLLVMKCASSEMMNSLASKLEADAAEKMLTRRNEASRLDVQTLLPLTNAEEIDEVSQNISSAVKTEDKSQGANENGDALVVVVDSTMIEVVNDVSVVGADVESSAPVPVSSNGELKEEVPDAVLSEEVVRRQARTASLDEKDKRYKMREESLVAYSIKNQLRSTVASFEEDHVSLVVDNTLGSREKGLNLASTRCRGVSCNFCGLSDAALGSPLLRVPNMEEWYELMPHMARNRQVFLVADLSRRPSSDLKNSTVLSKSRGKSLLAVKIRVGGELMSNANDAHFEGIPDGGMLEFLPRNEEGYQNELSIRHVADIPFISGSLSAHECCAISAHNARKERVISEYKSNKEVSLERDAGILCGRTLSLGRDRRGRSFWKFNADNALFVCDGDDTKIWRRYEDPEVIASVLFSLGKDPVVAEIRRVFPDAVRLLRGRKWTQLLLKRPFKKTNDSLVVASSANATKVPGAEDMEDEDEPYQPGEDVLVESKCGRMLWDAKVLVVSHKDDKVNGYRVRYKGWSSRFDEWVTPFRVVEPIEANIAIQEEMIQELHQNEIIVPDVLKKMNARKHVNSKDRARSRARIPEFTDVAKVPPTASSGERGLAWAKAALLMIEAALPCGAIDNSTSGAWRPAIAAEWRKVVQTAQGPYTLMGCAFLLEETIDPEWIDPHATHLLSCLPQRWKSIREATVSSLCLRIVMLDQGVQYDTVDKSKYIGKGRGEH